MSADVETLRQAYEAISADLLPHEAKVALVADLPKGVTGTGATLFLAALQDWRMQATKELAEVNASVSELQAKLDSFQEELQEAQKIEKELIEEADQAVEKALERTKTVKELEAQHKKAEESSLVQAKLWRLMHEDHAKAKSVAEGPLTLLEAGSWEEEGTKSASLEAVESLLADTTEEQALLSCAGASLGLKPDARKNFDNIVVKAVKDGILDKLHDMESKVESESAAERLARSELLGLWAISDCARDDAVEALSAEAELLKKRKAATREAQRQSKRHKSLQDERSVLVASRDACQKTLELIEAAAAATKRLRDAAAGQAPPDASGSPAGG